MLSVLLNIITLVCLALALITYIKRERKYPAGTIVHLYLETVLTKSDERVLVKGENREMWNKQPATYGWQLLHIDRPHTGKELYDCINSFVAAQDEASGLTTTEIKQLFIVQPSI